MNVSSDNKTRKLFIMNVYDIMHNQYFSLIVIILILITFLLAWRFMYMGMVKKNAFEGNQYGWSMADTYGVHDNYPEYGCGGQSYENKCHSKCAYSPHGENYSRCMEAC